MVHDFDVIVLDLTLPGMDGLEVARKLRGEAHKQTPILMLTARDALEQKLTGFESGADDYMTKPFALQELAARLEVLARRGKGPQSRVLKVADLTFNLDTLTVKREGKSIQLNPIGLKLLQALMEASPSVVTRQELEQRVWGEELARYRFAARAYPRPARGDRQAVREAADPYPARHRLSDGRSGCSRRRRLRSRLIVSFALFGFGLSALFALAALNIRARVENELVSSACSRTSIRRSRTSMCIRISRSGRSSSVHGCSAIARCIARRFRGRASRLAYTTCCNADENGLPRHYKLAVRRRYGFIAFITYDVSRDDLGKRQLNLALVGAVLLFGLLSLVLGFWLSRKVIKPVTELAARLRAAARAARRSRWRRILPRTRWGNWPLRWTITRSGRLAHGRARPRIQRRRQPRIAHAAGGDRHHHRTAAWTIPISPRR